MKRVFHQTPFLKPILHQTHITPETFYTRHSLHQTLLTPNNSYTKRILHQRGLTNFTPDTFYMKRVLLYTRHVLHQTHITPDTFYTKNILHQKRFTSNISCTRQLLHQTPFTLDTFYTKNILYQKSSIQDAFYTKRIFKPKTFYTKHILHQTPFTPNAFFTRHVLYEKKIRQEDFTPYAFYTRHFLHQTFFTPNSSTPNAFYTRDVFAPKTFHTRHFFYTKRISLDSFCCEACWHAACVKWVWFFFCAFDFLNLNYWTIPTCQHPANVKLASVCPYLTYLTWLGLFDLSHFTWLGLLFWRVYFFLRVYPHFKKDLWWGSVIWNAITWGHSKRPSRKQVGNFLFVWIPWVVRIRLRSHGPFHFMSCVTTTLLFSFGYPLRV